MASLKQISDQIADALSRPFDDMFKERVKAVFRQQLATLIRQQVNKNGIDSQFKTRYSTECIPVNYADSSLFSGELDNTCFRTINKVAKPIRYNTDEPFTYVGNISGRVPYRYISVAAMPYEEYMPMVQKTHQVDEGVTPTRPIKYDYRNDYIYIYFDSAVTLGEGVTTIPIMVEGVHSSYGFIGNESKEANEKALAYTDEIDFPMPDDIIQNVKEMILKGEFSIIDDKDKVVAQHIDNN